MNSGGPLGSQPRAYLCDGPIGKIYNKKQSTNGHVKLIFVSLIFTRDMWIVFKTQ